MKHTFSPLALPDLPRLELQEDVRIISQYLSDRYGVPLGTVLISLVTALSSLQSRSTRIIWQDDVSWGCMRVLLLDGLSTPGFSWLDTFTEPLDQIAGTLRSLSDDQKRRLMEDYESGVANFLFWPEGFPMKLECSDKAHRCWDELHSVRYRTLPPKLRSEFFTFEYCPLIIRKDHLVVDWANQDASGKSWMAMFKGYQSDVGVAAPTAFLLSANRVMISRYAQGDFALNEFPMILPQGSGPLRPPTVKLGQANDAWRRLLTDASETWNRPRRYLTVSAYGADALTGIKRFTESLRPAHLHPERYSWVLSSCISLAAWDHLAQGQGDEIRCESWEFATRLSQWAIQAHMECLRLCTRAKVCPPQKEDLERIRNRVRANPGITHRELVRALPKRAKGYWEGLYRLLEEVPQSLRAKITENAQFNGHANPRGLGPTLPTDPTTDRVMKSVVRAMERHAAMTKPLPRPPSS